MDGQDPGTRELIRDRTPVFTYLAMEFDTVCNLIDLDKTAQGNLNLLQC